MTALKPAEHARQTHRPAGTLGPDDPGGSDALPVAWVGVRFNVDNEGGSLQVVANDAADLEGVGDFGIALVDRSGFGIWIQSTSSIDITGSPVRINGAAVGTIGDITSGDGSVTVTNPTGPTTDLAVAGVDGGSA